jgi:4-hydroxybenzoate polyprenyltransferase
MKLFPGKHPRDFFRLIRLPNLIIVALTMILMRYAVLKPLLNAMPVEMADNPLIVTRMAFQMGWFDFLILVLSTVLISAGGYVINDYFDIRTDLINRGSIIVGNTISRRMAMLYHNVFSFLGVAGGFYVSARIGYFWLGTLFLLVSGLLYFYSVTYKRQFLIGNLIVAFLTAMVPFMVVLFEAPPIYKIYSVSTVEFPGVILLYYWVGGFALFAFMTTLIREIIKDIEDYEGDLTFGRKTLPVVSGLFATKMIVIALSVLTIIMLYLVCFMYLPGRLTLAYVTMFVVLPLIWVIIKVLLSKNRDEFHKASRMVKIIMLCGILYSAVAGAIITSGKIL